MPAGEAFSLRLTPVLEAGEMLTGEAVSLRLTLLLEGGEDACW
jgi:hypothetical protein